MLFGKFSKPGAYPFEFSWAAAIAAVGATEQALVPDLADLSFDRPKDCELPAAELSLLLQLISNSVK